MANIGGRGCYLRVSLRLTALGVFAFLSILLLGTQLADGQSLPIKPIDVAQMPRILGEWVAAIIKEIKEQGAWAR